MATKTKKKAASRYTKKNTKKRSAAKKTVKKKSAAKRKTNSVDIKSVAAFAICFILIVSFITGIVFLNVERTKPANGKEISRILKKDKAWGIDVSSHNGKIDWKKVSTKADFAFIRVGYRGYAEGEINFDKQMKNNLKGAAENGVPVGVYFYTQAINEKEAEEEADFVLKKIKGYDVKLPVVIDFEYATRNGKRVGRLAKAKHNNKKRTAIVNAFCNKVRTAGYTPGIYASSYIYRSYLNMKKFDGDIFIWVADYNSSVTYKGFYDIWQYSETGKCPGIKNKADTNYWYTKKRLQGD
ncbi:MAG: hypothetical protein IJT65_08475 [Eubacterium sp.]|nr:hypothetical protein [Eubacterium sp.]